jgi:hypothetical protein
MKTSFALLSALTLSACNLVQMPGGTSTGPSAPTAAAPRNPDAPPSRPVGDLAQYYGSLKLAPLYHLINDEREDQIYERAKTDVGRDRLWQSPNPDPAWILMWRNQDWTNASDNAEAMTQAAFNRAWEASCVAEAASTRKVHTQLAGKMAPELVRVDGLANYYERMAGYVALAAQFEAEAGANGIAIDKDPSGPVGFRVTILTHAVAFHQQSRHAWSEFPWAKFPSAARVRRDDGGRELTDDAAFERARYCGTVAGRGGLTTTAFTRFWPDGHMSARRVMWPTVSGDERANKARAQTLVKETQAKLATKPGARVENIEKLFGLSAPGGEPKLAGFRDFKVTAVKGGTVKVTRSDTESYQYACRTTNRIDRIDDNNRVIYQQNCKWGAHDYRLDAELAFDELPPNVTLAVGDVINFEADVQKDTSKKLKDSPAKQEHIRTMVLAGRQLDRVQRGKDSLSW